MIKIELKNYPNLIIDKQTLQNLRWFKNNKIYSFTEDFNNIFDTSFNRDEYYRVNIFNSFYKNKLIQQYSRSPYDRELTNENPKFLVNLEHYLNAIIIKSLYSTVETKNYYEISEYIQQNHLNKYGRSKVIQMVGGNAYYNFNLSLIESYYQSRFKLKAFIIDCLDRQIINAQNHLNTQSLKIKYSNIIKEIKILLKDLNFNTETCAVSQDCITGLFFHKNYTLSFYKGVDLRELKEIITPFYNLFLLSDYIFDF